MKNYKNYQVHVGEIVHFYSSYQNIQNQIPVPAIVLAVNNGLRLDLKVLYLGYDEYHDGVGHIDRVERRGTEDLIAWGRSEIMDYFYEHMKKDLVIDATKKRNLENKKLEKLKPAAKKRNLENKKLEKLKPVANELVNS